MTKETEQPHLMLLSQKLKDLLVMQQKIKLQEILLTLYLMLKD
jgi:hypothetical protein